MNAQTETARVPRGLPEEQPVELVAVSSRAGRLGVALLAAILATVIYLAWITHSANELGVSNHNTLVEIKEKLK